LPLLGFSFPHFCVIICLLTFFCNSPELSNVRWVLPDSYLDVRNKDYGGRLKCIICIITWVWNWGSCFARPLYFCWVWNFQGKLPVASLRSVDSLLAPCFCVRL